MSGKTFAQHFNLGCDQAQLDFVNIPIDGDIPLFIDPYFLSVKDDLWSLDCHDAILSFFEAVLGCIKSKDDARGQSLLDNLSEPNETHLGLSRGRPQGRGVSGIQAQQVYQKLKKSRAAKKGLLSELSDFDLFIEGIGNDKVSDITTNIIRRQLIQYTADQCHLHNIATIQVASGHLWDSTNREWTQTYVNLPVVEGHKILLIPKMSARWSLEFSSEQYYNRFVLEYLRQEHLDSNSSLVEVLKSGRRRVTKKVLQKTFPFSKDVLAEFSESHPKVLREYKKSLGLPIEIKNEELMENFDEAAFASSLRDSLGGIPAGSDHATSYHRFVAGTLQFIFYPELIYPVLEDEIHEGRKRVDIRFTNSATSGFFYRRRTNRRSHAVNVYVECKNYSNDVANPELDQLAGRFAPNRGRLGFLLARTFEDRPLFVRRCHDTASDGNGFIIPLVDDDLRQLLGFIADGERERIDRFLEDRFQELIR